MQPSRIREVLAAFPAAPIDLDNITWYEGLLAGELRINRCRDCGAWHHPAGPRCPECWSDSLDPTAVSGQGTVELFTVLHIGPAADGVDYEAGHPLVAVSLDGVPDIRVTGPLVEYDATRIHRGLRVEFDVLSRGGVPTLVFRELSSDRG